MDSRALLKSLLPAMVVSRIRQYEQAKRGQILRGMKTNEAIFSAVYRHRMWGGGRADYYSGHGSHRESISRPYITAVSTFLESRSKLSAVDLGCGDFTVGSQLRDLCDRYVACDVVASLIDRNRTIYNDIDVDFRHLDIGEAELPSGDVVFLREVLQHLDNNTIKSVVDQLPQYRYAIITELLPNKAFVPNVDKAAGFDVRLKYGSGIDVAAPPFSLRFTESTVLLELNLEEAVSRVVLYTMR
jgi:SAM-dependent methyltransferase